MSIEDGPAPVPSSWSRCSTHGTLPSFHFYNGDLRARRARCKQCARQQIAQYRMRHPLQRIWMRFVIRATKKFGRDATAGLRWQHQGIDCLRRVRRRAAVDTSLNAEEWCLTWPIGARVLDLTDVLLMHTKDARHRTRSGRPRHGASTGCSVATVPLDGTDSDTTV